MIYIQRGQDKICAKFLGRNVALLYSVRHSIRRAEYHTKLCISPVPGNPLRITYGVYIGLVKSSRGTLGIVLRDRAGRAVLKVRNQDRLGFGLAQSEYFIHSLWYTCILHHIEIANEPRKVGDRPGIISLFCSCNSSLVITWRWTMGDGPRRERRD